jgi:hypothetical protein
MNGSNMTARENCLVPCSKAGAGRYLTENQANRYPRDGFTGTAYKRTSIGALSSPQFCPVLVTNMATALALTQNRATAIYLHS